MTVIARLTPDGFLVHVAPSVQHVLGFESFELEGRSLFDFVHPDEAPRVHEALAEARRARGHCTVLYRHRNRRGGWAWLETVAFARRAPETSDVTGIFLSSRDVTCRMQLEEPGDRVVHVSDIGEFKKPSIDLEEKAHHDLLTGAGNRRLLEERVEAALVVQRAGGGSTSLAMIHVDDVKGLNDRFGHAAGDAVLVAVARRLQLAVRDKDAVARIGGDDFAVLFSGLHHAAEADRLAARLQEVFQSPVALGGDLPEISGSIGMAVATPYDTVDSLLRRADAKTGRSEESPTAPRGPR